MEKEERENRIAVLQSLILEKKKYLNESDYEAIKWSEGYPVDADIKTARETARSAINSAQSEISEIEAIVDTDEADTGVIGEE